MRQVRRALDNGIEQSLICIDSNDGIMILNDKKLRALFNGTSTSVKKQKSMQ